MAPCDLNSLGPPTLHLLLQPLPWQPKETVPCCWRIFCWFASLCYLDWPLLASLASLLCQQSCPLMWPTLLWLLTMLLSVWSPITQQSTQCLINSLYIFPNLEFLWPRLPPHHHVVVPPSCHERHSRIFTRAKPIREWANSPSRGPSSRWPPTLSQLAQRPPHYHAIPCFYCNDTFCIFQWIHWSSLAVKYDDRFLHGHCHRHSQSTSWAWNSWYPNTN